LLESKSEERRVAVQLRVSGHLLVPRIMFLGKFRVVTDAEEFEKSKIKLNK
jgi:hypothetical protein